MEKQKSKNRRDAAPRVAIIYPFLYHFREPILRLLCNQTSPNPEYTLFSGTDSNVPSLELIDPNLADKPVSDGGLRWLFLRNIWLRGNFLWQKGLIRICFSSDFDVVIFYGFRSYLSTWISAFLSRLRGKRVLIWSHGTYRDARGPHRWYQEIFFRLAHGVLLFGNRARDILIGWGFSPDSLYVVFNSLDYDRQRRAREKLVPSQLDLEKRRLFSNPNLPVIIFIGRLVSRKRLDLLLDASLLLADQQKQINILVIGEGPELAKLRSHAVKIGVNENVVFYGACHVEEELAPLISLSDLCVCPAAMGLTAMHALVYGIPVITHDRPELHGPEFEAIIPGFNGQIFRFNDPHDLARVIGEWITQTRSRAESTAACRMIIDTFYNPHFQVKIFNAAVAGKPATALAFRVESGLSHGVPPKG